MQNYNFGYPGAYPGVQYSSLLGGTTGLPYFNQIPYNSTYMNPFVQQTLAGLGQQNVLTFPYPQYYPFTAYINIPAGAKNVNPPKRDIMPGVDNGKFRIVVRGLQARTSKAFIAKEFAKLGYSVISATNAKSRIDGRPLNVFFVELGSKRNNMQVFNVTRLCHKTVRIEAYLYFPNIPQCRRCQEFGHTYVYCTKDYRCVKCGMNHCTKDCCKSRDDPPKCALCGGPHTANYKGCEVYKKALSVFLNNNGSPIPNTNQPSQVSLAIQVLPPAPNVQPGIQMNSMSGTSTETQLPHAMQQNPIAQPGSVASGQPPVQVQSTAGSYNPQVAQMPAELQRLLYNLQSNPTMSSPMPSAGGSTRNPPATAERQCSSSTLGAQSSSSNDAPRSTNASAVFQPMFLNNGQPAPRNRAATISPDSPLNIPISQQRQLPLPMHPPGSRPSQPSAAPSVSNATYLTVQQRIDKANAEQAERAATAPRPRTVNEGSANSARSTSTDAHDHRCFMEDIKWRLEVIAGAMTRVSTQNQASEQTCKSLQNGLKDINMKLSLLEAKLCNLPRGLFLMLEDKFNDMPRGL